MREHRALRRAGSPSRTSRSRKTANAIVVGFNVRPNANARELAEREGVDIRLYRVIYDAIDDVKAALSGSSRRSARRSRRGRDPPDVPRAAARRDRGLLHQRGTIRRNSQVRLVRDGVVSYEGRGLAASFKDDVARYARASSAGSAWRTSRT